LCTVYSPNTLQRGRRPQAAAWLAAVCLRYPLPERYRLAVTASTTRQLDVSYRWAWRAGILKVSNLFNLTSAFQLRAFCKLCCSFNSIALISTEEKRVKTFVWESNIIKERKRKNRVSAVTIGCLCLHFAQCGHKNCLQKKLLPTSRVMLANHASVIVMRKAALDTILI